MVQMGVEKDGTIHFISYISFFESCKIIFAKLVTYHMKKGGFSKSYPILKIRSTFSMHTCTSHWLTKHSNLDKMDGPLQKNC